MNKNQNIIKQDASHQSSDTLTNTGGLRILHEDPSMPAAWGPWFSHEYITYYSVMPIGEIMGMPPVPVMPNPDIDDPAWPQGPNHIDLYKEDYRETRRLDPFRTFDYLERNGIYGTAAPANATVEPWKVLVIYSTEPDLSLDYDLTLHRRQRYTGGSHGWRHMRFHALGLTIGIAPESFRHHRRMAVKNYGSGNRYWGWRQLSRSTHYLADLGNPFHVKAAPLEVLLKGARSFRKTFKTISASHQGFEVFTERRFREGCKLFGESLKNGAAAGFSQKEDVDKNLNTYISRADKRLNEIFRFFTDTFGRELIEVFEQMDKYRHLDAAAQTNRCSADAARVIFRDAGPPLDFLDRLTGDILFDVGRMLGMLYAGFLADIMKKK